MLSSSLNAIAVKVRNQLKEYYRDTDAISNGSALTTSTAAFVVANGARFVVGDIIEIESEVMLVQEAPAFIDYGNEGSEITAIDTTIAVNDGTLFTAAKYYKIDQEIIKVSSIATNDLTVVRGMKGTEAATHYQKASIYHMDKIRVQRGYDGSTATTHADTTAISICNRFSNYVTIENIKDIIRGLYPHIYKEKFEDITLASNYKLIDDCDTVSAWTASGDAGTPTTNSEDAQEGTYCLDLSATYSAGTASLLKASLTSFDSTPYRYLNIRCYLEDIKDDNDDYYLAHPGLTIELGSGSSAYKLYSLGRPFFQKGWNMISLLIEDFGTGAGTPSMTAITHLKLNFKILQSIGAGDLKIDEVSMTTFPMSSHLPYIKLPAETFIVNDVRLWSDLNEGKSFDKVRAFQLKYPYVLLDEPISSGRPVQIIGADKYIVPSTNSASFDLPDEGVEEYLVVSATIKTIEQNLQMIMQPERVSVKLQQDYMLYIDREKRRLADRRKELFETLAKSPGYFSASFRDEIE